jgi:CheY-like chemotaxis protein
MGGVNWNHRQLKILVVEDVMLIAFDIADELRGLGCSVIGPFSRLSDALQGISRSSQLDGAFLDVNLAGEPCFPLAELLDQKNVPFVFLTGHAGSEFPEHFKNRPRIQKPFHGADLERAVQRYFLRPQPARNAG